MATILVVDDRPTNREFLATLLGYRGHRVLQAGDGAEGLAEVRAKRPHLVITDVLMPRMDGFEFLRQLRADPDIAAIPVIFYTARYHPQEIRALAGVIHHLPKPSEPEEILRLVTSVLAAPPVAPAPLSAEFERDHLRLLCDKLARKVGALEAEMTRRQQVEEALRENHGRLQGLVTSAMDAIIIIDAQQRITLFNPAAEQMFGIAFSAALGEPIGRFIPERFRAIHAEHVRRFAASGTTSRRMGAFNAITALRSNGEEFPVEASISHVEIESKQFLSVILRDISERKRAEEALRKSEEKYHHLVETSHDIIFAVDLEGRITFINQASRRVYGYEPEEMIGRVYSEFITPEQLQKNQAFGQKVLTTGGPITDYENEVLRKDGTPVILSTHAVFLRDPMGNIVGSAGIARDITDRKRTEEELCASRERLATLSRQLLAAQETERRRLARELHDELGQVLTLVKMNVQAAQRVAQDAARQRLDAALDVAQQAIAQVRSLSLELRPSMLDDFGLKAALEWFVGRQAEPGGPAIELDGNLDEGRLATEVETACFRVVQEAVTNAQRHSQAKRIHICAERIEDALVVSVRDDGVGFDVAAARQRATRGGSTGLLSMEERVRLLEGDFRITTAPGRGVEVWASFPVSKANQS